MFHLPVVCCWVGYVDPFECERKNKNVWYPCHFCSDFCCQRHNFRSPYFANTTDSFGEQLLIQSSSSGLTLNKWQINVRHLHSLDWRHTLEASVSPLAIPVALQVKPSTPSHSNDGKLETQLVSIKFPDSAFFTWQVKLSPRLSLFLAVLQITRDGNNCTERWRSGNSLLALFLPQIFPPLVNGGADILQAGRGLLPQDVGPGLPLEQSGGGQRCPRGPAADQVVGRQRGAFLRDGVGRLFAGGAQRPVDVWCLEDADGLKGQSWDGVRQSRPAAPVSRWQLLSALVGGRDGALPSLGWLLSRVCFGRRTANSLVERHSWDGGNDPVLC